MTTICCAPAVVAGIAAANMRNVAAINLRNAMRLSNIIAPSAFSPMQGLESAHPALIILRSNSPSRNVAVLSRVAEGAGAAGGWRTIVRCPPQRAQAHLHHIGMVDRHAAAVGIVCNIIQGQDEAV